MIRFFSFIRPAFNNLSYQIYIRAEWRSRTYALEHWTLDFSRNAVFRFILLVLVLQQVHQKFGPQYIPCLHMQYYSSLNIFAPTNYTCSIIFVNAGYLCAFREVYRHSSLILLTYVSQWLYLQFNPNSPR